MEEIDNLDLIEAGGAQPYGLSLSNVYSVRIGGFGVDPNMKTYLSTLTVDELEADISFYESLSADKDWPVSQIIQREIDQDRVNSIAKKYLLGAGRLVKYFPPIIVALLPRMQDGSFARSFTFDPDLTPESKDLIYEKSKYRTNEGMKKVFMQKENGSIVSGLYVFSTSSIFEHNMLCWDKEKFYAVVIDGQHRLDALIKGKKESAEYRGAIQDVIFLDVSYLVRQHQQHSPIEVLRSVFIDINTNAKSVGLVRRILMDDKDLASLCVQSLVESVKSDGTDKPTGSFVPSFILDWHGESLRHELPHVTGILSLYQTLSDELVSNRLLTIDDHRKQKKIKLFIENLNNYFFVDETILKTAEWADVKKLEESFNEYLEARRLTAEVFSEQLEDVGLESLLFNYDYRVLEVAQSNFEKYYLNSIIRIITDFLPYRKAIACLSEIGGADTSTNLYKALLTSRLRIAANAMLRNVFLEAKKTLGEQLDSNYFLLFTVVGQKSVFTTFFEQLLPRVSYGTTPQKIDEIQSFYLSELNDAVELLTQNNIAFFGKDDFNLTPKLSEELQELGTVATSFWEGILFEDKRIIYNSQGVKAFSDVLKFLVLAIKQVRAKQETSELKQFRFRFSSQRTQRLLFKRFDGRSENEIATLADKILLAKKEAMIAIIEEVIG